jgi:hypothetical protein
LGVKLHRQQVLISLALPEIIKALKENLLASEGAAHKLQELFNSG